MVSPQYGHPMSIGSTPFMFSNPLPGLGAVGHLRVPVSRDSLAHGRIRCSPNSSEGSLEKRADRRFAVFLQEAGAGAAEFRSAAVVTAAPAPRMLRRAMPAEREFLSQRTLPSRRPAAWVPETMSTSPTSPVKAFPAPGPQDIQEIGTVLIDVAHDDIQADCHGPVFPGSICVACCKRIRHSYTWRSPFRCIATSESPLVSRSEPAGRVSPQGVLTYLAVFVVADEDVHLAAYRRFRPQALFRSQWTRRRPLSPREDDRRRRGLHETRPGSRHRSGYAPRALAAQSRAATATASLWASDDSLNPTRIAAAQYR